MNEPHPKGWVAVTDWQSTFHKHDAECWEAIEKEQTMPGHGRTEVVRCKVIYDRFHPEWSVYVKADLRA